MSDPFAYDVIASDVAESQPSESLHNWRRLFPNARAKAIPLREIDNTAHVPTEMRTSSLAIAEQNATQPTDRNNVPFEQGYTPGKYVPVCPDRATVLRLLKSVPPPLSVKRIARALQWPEHRAAKWLRVFAAKGELVATGKGHVWRSR